MCRLDSLVQPPSSQEAHANIYTYAQRDKHTHTLTQKSEKKEKKKNSQDGREEHVACMGEDSGKKSVVNLFVSLPHPRRVIISFSDHYFLPFIFLQMSNFETC